MDKIVSSKYSLYLVEIRKRILITVFVFAISTVSGFIFYEQIIKFIIVLLSLERVNIVFTSPFQFINLAISCGVAAGLIITFPLLIYQVLSFLKPALREREFKMIVKFLPFFIILFLIGFSFGIFVMKWQIGIFLAKSESLGIGNILDISRLISTVLLVSVMMGLAFQFPTVTLLLMRIGIISSDTLSKRRLWVYLGSLLFVMLLPADSILTDILLALPLIGLFEITLILNRIVERGRLTTNYPK